MSLLGIPIIEHPWMADDQIFISNDWGANDRDGMLIVVGTKEPDPVKLAGREARLAVRRGLADVLAWLGQPVVNEPVMARLRAEDVAPKPIWMP